MPDLIGRSFGRYHIIEPLGEGGMAAVYRALDTTLERDVALKVIRTDKVTDPQFITRFEREAKALARLSHPHIVKINDFGEQEGVPYLVMEFLPGGTLKQKQGKALPYQEVARLLAPVARALEYAHEKDVIHRDVKPANILLTDRSLPMLSDFGIAKFFKADSTVLTGTGVGIGTPEYMAPEQSQGHKVDHRADIYALGVVFYELLTGRRPYEADTPIAVIIKHINDPLPSPRQFVPELPYGVEQVIIKALQKDPASRYQDMGKFAEALEKLSHDILPASEVHQIKVTKKDQIDSGFSKKARYWAASIILLISIVAGVILWSGRTRQQNEVSDLQPDIIVETVLVTKTPAPTVNPSQTAALPEATEVSVQVEILEESGTLIFEEEFDSYLSSVDWEMWGDAINLEDGKLHFSGQPTWPGLKLIHKIQRGRAVLVLFSYRGSADLVYKVERGSFDSDMFKNWGFKIMNNYIYSHVTTGANDAVLGGMSGGLKTTPGHLYYAWLEAQEGGIFYVRVWDAEAPDNYREIILEKGETWANNSWNLILSAGKGTVILENLQLYEIQE